MAGKVSSRSKHSRMVVFWFFLVYYATPISGQNDTPLKYSVKEEEGQGAFLGNIFNDARLFTIYNTTVQTKLQWSILEQSQNWDDYFSVSNQGLFLTAGPIDREDICPYLDSCIVSLNIQILPYQYFKIIKVEVEVLDINDNIPQFSVGEAEISLPESSTPGTSLGIPAAEDQDSPRFGVTRYTLIPSTDLFELSYSLDEDEEDIFLVLKGTLDREETEKYTLQIVAADGGTPENTAVLTVEIQILDINDNSPKFDQENYSIQVTENLEVGSAILTLSASDPDQGSKIIYSFSERTSTSIGDIFDIVQDTGTILSKGKIDYEERNSYTLNVIARDESLLTLSAQAVVQIDIVDLNDNAPNIQLNIFSGNSTHVLMEEGAKAGRSVAHMVVTDPDSGSGGQFDCFLGNNNFELDKISESDFKILTTTALDREQSSSYKIGIRCDDHGFPPLHSNKTVVVVVLDVNDNAPVFSQLLYRSSMLLNSSVGKFLLQVQAQDRDEGLSGVVSYAILPPMDQVFRINTTTGDISVKTPTSFVGRAWVNFTVQASDHGLPGKVSIAHVVIDIIHIIDAIPKFIQNLYTFNVMENVPERTEVGGVSLQPSLHGLDIKFVFRIISQTEGNMFTIDESTGKLYTAKVPDREETDTYHLVLSAGVGEIEKTSTTEVTVFIEDENDNAPVLFFPGGSRNLVEVSSNIPEGHQIAKIEASDADKDENKLLSYMISSGNEKGFFAMNKNTGSLFLRQELTARDDLFNIGITVQDEGRPPLSSEGNLRVKINSTLASAGETKSSLLILDRPTVLALGIVGGLIILVMVVVILTVRWFKKYSKDYKDIEDKMKKLEHSNNNGEGQSVNGTHPSGDSDGDSRRSQNSYAAYDDPTYVLSRVHVGPDSDSGWSSDMPNHDSSREAGLITSGMLPLPRHDRGAHRRGSLWDTQIPEDDLYEPTNSQLSSSQEDGACFNGKSRHRHHVHPHHHPHHHRLPHLADLPRGYSLGNELFLLRQGVGRRNSSLSYDGNQASVSMAPEPYRHHHSEGSRCSTPQNLDSSKVYAGKPRRMRRERPLFKTGSWSSDSTTLSSETPDTDSNTHRKYKSHNDIHGHQSEPQRLATSADISVLRQHSSPSAYRNHRHGHKEHGPPYRERHQRTLHDNVSHLRESSGEDCDSSVIRPGSCVDISNTGQSSTKDEGVKSNGAPPNLPRRHSSADFLTRGIPLRRDRRSNSHRHGDQSGEQHTKSNGFLNLASNDVLEELEEVTV